jgi:glycosyltransferase involved in cell wall biosynthesis
MRIAFIGQKGIPNRGGGIEKYAEDLAVRLASLGHEVIVYTRPYYTDKKIKEFKGVKLISLPSIRTKHLDAITHSILASIDVLFRKVDIVHYQNIGPALAMPIPKIFSRKLKIVSTLQSKDYKHRKWGSFARDMLRLGEVFLCKLSDEVIVISSEMEKYAQGRFGNKNLTLIPNGTNFKEKKSADKIKNWGLDENNYIVSIARLIKHKGLGYLIAAFKEADLHPEMKLAMVGDGVFTDDYVKELYELAAGDARIVFTGNQTGEILDELYANAALFVQPSEAEGLSLALLEAMSYGRPTLVSDIPENLEAVNSFGYTFKSKDQDDLKIQLEKIFSHIEEAESEGKKLQARARENYDWDWIVKKVENLYTKCVNPHK